MMINQSWPKKYQNNKYPKICQNNINLEDNKHLPGLSILNLLGLFWACQACHRPKIVFFSMKDESITKKFFFCRLGFVFSFFVRKKRNKGVTVHYCALLCITVHYCTLLCITVRSYDATMTN